MSSLRPATNNSFPYQLFSSYEKKNVKQVYYSSRVQNDDIFRFSVSFCAANNPKLKYSLQWFKRKAVNPHIGVDKRECLQFCAWLMTSMEHKKKVVAVWFIAHIKVFVEVTKDTLLSHVYTCDYVPFMQISLTVVNSLLLRFALTFGISSIEWMRKWMDI